MSLRIPKAVGGEVVAWRPQEPIPGKEVVCQAYLLPGQEKTRNYYSWVGGNPVLVFAATPKGLVVLNRYWRGSMGDITVIEAPGGHAITEGMSIDEIARDRLLAKTGYTPGKLITLPPVFLDPASNKVRLRLVLALDCTPTGSPTPSDSDEFEVVTMPFAEMVQATRRHDHTFAAHTVVLLWAAAPYLPDGLKWDLVRLLCAPPSD